MYSAGLFLIRAPTRVQGLREHLGSSPLDSGGHSKKQIRALNKVETNFHTGWVPGVRLFLKGSKGFGGRLRASGFREAKGGLGLENFRFLVFRVSDTRIGETRRGFRVNPNQCGG